MNSFGFNSLANAWLFALLAPLVLFYFLKLKRPRLRIPSLALWQQILTDRRVNSPFQRFKRNILLMLQILVLLLLATAALQPFWRLRPQRAQRLVALLDCSASMAALDKAGGTSRLDVARQRIDEMIANLLPDQELCLLAFSRGTRKCADFTDDRRLLRDALAAVQVEDVPGDIEEALRTTQALSRGGPLDEVFLFSDGNFPARASIDLSFRLDYQRLPAGGPNVGITSLHAARSGEGAWDVFLLLEGSADAEGPVTVDISLDGESLASRVVSLGELKEERIAFRAPGERASHLEVRLTPDGFDSLASDDVAYLDLPAVRPLQAFVSPSLVTYRHALEVLKGIDISPAGGSGGEAGSGYDLVISDQAPDGAVPGRTCLYVGVVPEDLQGLVTVTTDGATAVDWDRGAPLLQHVELADLVIMDCPTTRERAGESDYEAMGYEVLVHGERGPLLLQKRQGDGMQFFLLFHTDRSTLPYRVGFPVLTANAVRIAMQQAGLWEAQAARTGVLPEMVLEPTTAYDITAPDGRRRTEQTDGAGLLAGVPAPRVGRYTMSGGRHGDRLVGASLLTAAETTLKSAEEILFAEDLSVAASDERVLSDRPLWPLLALLAFAVMLGEWWYYNKGTGGHSS